MNKLLFLLSFALFLPLYMQAQSKSIIDDLNTNKGPSEGKIVIYQDESIKNMVGSTITVSSEISGSNDLQVQLSPNMDSSYSGKNFLKAKGYRIQVFSGSDQKTAKNIAQNRKSNIQSTYPNMSATVTYSSPVWRVRAGDFKTIEQAQQALTDMKVKFPSFGREMRIVEDVIKVPMN